MTNVKCEHPVVIFNPHLKYLYCTKAIAIRLGDRMVCVKRSPRDYYNFPWHYFSPYKSQITAENIDDYFLYDEQDNTYPIFLMVPCGKCRLCKQEKVDQWMTRCICESTTSPYPPLFITLTYDRKHYPADGVSKSDIQLFLKRLRRRVEYNLGVKTNLRYFLVSEYGKKTHRGHYHMLLWNMPYVSMREGDKNSFYALWTFIRDAWQNGFVRVEYCRDNSGKYCFKYMRKECIVPDGKNPTFHLASRRPGLGFLWLQQHFSEYYNDPSAISLQIQSLDKNGVPTVLSRPIPQYFKRKLWPTVCQLFPQPVSNAVRDFMEHSAKSFLLQRELYPNSYRSLDVLSMVEDILEKYSSIFPIDFQAAYPNQIFVEHLRRYQHFRDAEGSVIPSKDFRSFSSAVTLDVNSSGDAYFRDVEVTLPGKDTLSSDFFSKRVTGVLDAKECYTYRKEFIESWRILHQSYLILMDYDFSEEYVLSVLRNTARHSATVKFLNEKKPPVDISAAIHQYEVDRRWETIHWREDCV